MSAKQMRVYCWLLMPFSFWPAVHSDLRSMRPCLAGIGWSSWSAGGAFLRASLDRKPGHRSSFRRASHGLSDGAYPTEGSTQHQARRSSIIFEPEHFRQHESNVVDEPIITAPTGRSVHPDSRRNRKRSSESSYESWRDTTANDIFGGYRHYFLSHLS